MIKFFKVRIGYGAGDDTFVSIDESELETAIYAFLTDQKAVFKNGVARGRDIISITEDWHRAMGWNQSYKMGPDDWAEVNARLPEYRGAIARTREKIAYLIQSGQQHLIGKNVDMPSMPQLEVHREIDQLAEKMKIS